MQGKYFYLPLQVSTHTGKNGKLGERKRQTEKDAHPKGKSDRGTQEKQNRGGWGTEGVMPGYWAGCLTSLGLGAR